MTHTVQVTHTFETGHRLPHLEGKCQSLHGHSWQVQVVVQGHPDERGVLVEFAALKKHLRGWVDEYLDHGLMLATQDPLAPVLPAHGKVFLFGAAGATGLALSSPHAADLDWPTVENVATLLARIMQEHLAHSGEDTHCHVEQVHVQETAVNRATWHRL